MGKDDLKLLTMWASPYCMKVKVALAEKGVEYEELEEHNLFGGKTELLLKSNPVHKQVPVLLHDGKPIVESGNIVSYIDETWASPPLLPPTAYERSRTRFWADFIDRKVFGAGKGIWCVKGEDEVEAGKEQFLDILKYLDGALGKRDFFNGDTFGFLDISLIGISSWFCVFEKYGGFKVADHYPTLSAWIKRCMERESVSKTIPDPEKILACAAMIRQMNGLE